MLKFNQLSYRFSTSGITLTMGLSKKIEPQNNPKNQEKSMFRKSPTKKTLKPTVLGLAKYAAKFKATLDFDYQTFNEDSNFDEQLKKIIASFQMIEKSLTEKIGDPIAHSKEFQKNEELLEKMLAKFRDIQEKFLNAEKTLEEKLVSRLKDVKPPEASNSKTYDETKKRLELSIKEIDGLITKGKQKISQLQIEAHSALKLAFNLKPIITQFLLPECLDQCEKQAKKLSEKLEFLCKISAANDSDRKSASALEQEKIHSILPHINTNLKTCAQLFDQAITHLKPSASTLMLMSASAMAATGVRGTNRNAAAAENGPNAANDPNLNIGGRNSSVSRNDGK